VFVLKVLSFRKNSSLPLSFWSVYVGLLTWLVFFEKENIVGKEWRYKIEREGKGTKFLSSRKSSHTDTKICFVELEMETVSWEDIVLLVRFPSHPSCLPGPYTLPPSQGGGKLFYSQEKRVYLEIILPLKILFLAPHKSTNGFGSGSWFLSLIRILIQIQILHLHQLDPSIVVL